MGSMITPHVKAASRGIWESRGHREAGVRRKAVVAPSAPAESLQRKDKKVSYIYLHLYICIFKNFYVKGSRIASKDFFNNSNGGPYDWDLFK